MQNRPLYHGTDARILAMTDDEREKWRQMCQLSVDFLWQIFDPYYNQTIKIVTNKPYEGCWKTDRRIEELKPLLTIDGNETKFYNLYDTLICVNGQKSGDPLYQYGGLYLTNTLGRATSYARRAFAFGEIGRNAYRMLDAAKLINVPNWDPSPEVEKALSMIQHFAESQAEPIILEFTDYDVNLLRGEDMRELPPKMYVHGGGSFCYLGSLDFKNAKRITI